MPKSGVVSGSAFSDFDLIVSFFFFLIVIGSPILNSEGYFLFASDLNCSVFAVAGQVEIIMCLRDELLCCGGGCHFLIRSVEQALVEALDQAMVLHNARPIPRLRGTLLCVREAA